ncbi:hypothetical protein K492DRAFT_238275 [Lichtheimia hyalospora FSU 10163]|nr:hypothetical protein K492DRAFT_238275 [Lichtheimia hyalospora FSU 10163]
MNVPELPDPCATESRVNQEHNPNATPADDKSDKTMAYSIIKKPSEQQQPKGERTTCVFDIPGSMLTQRHPSFNNVHMITAEQYAELYTTYMSTPLPNDILFPWLHGVDGQYYLQNLFFGVDQVEIPRHRGFMIVHADSMNPHHARIIHSVLPHEILDNATSDDTSFVDTSRGPNVHLRNFKIQVARYATISDIVVYGCDAHAVATRIANAQTKLREKRLMEKGNDNVLEYRVLMIRDPFSLVEQHYPHLVGYDSRGVSIHNISFSECERKEIRAMSEMNEITPHIWVGNTSDVPGSNRPWNDDVFNNGDSYSSDDDMENPYRFSICIESYDLAEIPQQSTLMLARETLNDLSNDQLPPEIIHLEAPCSFTPMSMLSFEQFFDKMIPLLEFMDNQASVHGRNILIHCADGYSETSLLVLSWIMYKLRIRLPEAYLFLHERRNFFVLASNILVLQLIQHSIFHPADKPKEIESQKRKRDDYEEHQNQPDKRDGPQPSAKDEIHDLKAGYARINVDQGNELTKDVNDDGHANRQDQLDYLPIVSDHRLLHDDTYLNIVSNHLMPSSTLHDNYNNNDTQTTTTTTTTPINESTHTLEGNNNDNDSSLSKNNTAIAIPAEDNEIWTHNLSSPLLPPIASQELAEFSWFYSTRFEGSFPSRILPNLYLGNLNHATNPDMLKALHITHVVSVGEHSGLDPTQFQLLFMDNLYDDGIDSIRGRWNEVTQFIGVSRSAAITIGYIMKQLGMSLVQAYLFVRARRLNVIIQPNLKFMYELLQLELQLFGKMSIPWPSLFSVYVMKLGWIFIG